MAGVWKKTLNYLGLVEEDEEFVDEMPEAEPAPVRRMRPQAVREVLRPRPRASSGRSPRHARPPARPPSTSRSRSDSTRRARSPTGSRTAPRSS